MSLETEDLELLDDDAGLDIDASGSEPNADGMYEHFRFVADKGQQLLRVDKFWS